MSDPIREAAEAWLRELYMHDPDHDDIDRLADHFKTRLRAAVPAKEVSNDLPGYLFHEALGHNNCRSELLGEK